MKPKPWWLFFTPGGFWVTLYPTIYYPKGCDPQAMPKVVAHERVHLEQQQAMGLWSWLLRYCLMPKFRLSQEAEAIAAEQPNELTIEWYARALASWRYLWAAPSPASAEVVIREVLHES
jgi:hypothetical protein